MKQKVRRTRKDELLAGVFLSLNEAVGTTAVLDLLSNTEGV
jgi:hypothetical protein